MKKNQLTAALVASSTLFFGGRFPVPPFSNEVSPELSGRVINKNNNKPIKGALVQTERAGYEAQAYTGADGSFVVPATKQWHYIVYLGSPGFYPTPWMFKAHNKDLHLSVQAEGHKTLTEVYPLGASGWRADVPSNLELKVSPE
ncbi:MAG: carboxypeptidase-like regulatory domain-containing protein [Akkermansiaceae bacterium]|jgi:hypothetical protein